MSRKLSMILFIGLLSFIMLACSMVFDTVINEDGSGTLTLSIHFSEEELEAVSPLLASYGAEMETPQEICDSITQDLTLGFLAETDFIMEGTEYTCLVEYEFDSLNELEMIYSNLDVYVYDLEFNEDGELVYDVDFDFEGESMDDYDIDIDLELEYFWNVTAPFTVIEHTGDRLVGKTVELEVDPTGYTSLYILAGAGGFTELYSESTLDFLTTIGEDESGMFQLDYKFDPDQEDELLELLEELDIGDEPEDWCDELGDQLEEMKDFPSRMDNEFIQEEEGSGFICSNIFEFDDLDELEELYEALGFIEIDSLKIRDDVLTYEVFIDLALAGDLGLDDLEADLELMWSVSSPWPLLENDADTEEDNLASWEMKDGDDIEIVFNAEKSNFLFYLIIGGAFVLLVVIVGVVVMIKRSKKSEVTE